MEPTVSEIVGELDALGLIESLRDDRGDVVMRPARDGTLQVVWVPTAAGLDRSTPGGGDE